MPQKILAEIKDNTQIKIIESGAFDNDRGKPYAISTTSNGYQWSVSHSFSRVNAIQLRDALNKLLGDV